MNLAENEERALKRLRGELFVAGVGPRQLPEMLEQ
jgi:hypothetical protein